MMKATPQPPGWATRLLNWLHPDETLEEVEGNLEELYAYWYEQSGKRHATLRYVLNVLSVLRQFVRQRAKKIPIFHLFLLHPNMLRNYFKIAIRDLWRNKTSGLINMIGLTIGTVCCLYTLMYIQAQSGYAKCYFFATYRPSDPTRLYRNNQCYPP